MAGTYIVQVDPTWHESASYHSDYKKVMIDIYCPLFGLNLQLVPEKKGIQYLVNALKDVAQNRVEPSNRKHHQSSREDYGKDVYRVADISASKCW